MRDGTQMWVGLDVHKDSLSIAALRGDLERPILEDRFGPSEQGRGLPRPGPHHVRAAQGPPLPGERGWGWGTGVSLAGGRLPGMDHVADLIAGLDLPPVEEALLPRPTDPELVHGLGADLPAGHLHVWGGPAGVGKTAFLLSLLHGAASLGRRVVYATYDLPGETLALRLLAMVAGVDAKALASGTLPAAEARRAAAHRAVLERLPFHVLHARGFSAVSLEDRLVRMPFRPEILAVDYLQAVIRDPNTDLGHALRCLSTLASRLHVAVICAARGGDAALLDAGCLVREGAESADRVGWIAPAAGSGVRRAEILRNRYGERPAEALRLDPSTGGIARASEAPGGSVTPGTPG